MFVFLFCRSRTQLISQAVQVFAGELCPLMCCCSLHQHLTPATCNFLFSFPIFLCFLTEVLISSFYFFLNAGPSSLYHFLCIPFTYLSLLSPFLFLSSVSRVFIYLLVSHFFPISFPILSLQLFTSFYSSFSTSVVIYLFVVCITPPADQREQSRKVG